MPGGCAFFHWDGLFRQDDVSLDTPIFIIPMILLGSWSFFVEIAVSHCFPTWWILVPPNHFSALRNPLNWIGTRVSLEWWPMKGRLWIWKAGESWIKRPETLMEHDYIPTVDGRHPAPVDIEFISLFQDLHTSQVVQDLFPSTVVQYLLAKKHHQISRQNIYPWHSMTVSLSRGGWLGQTNFRNYMLLVNLN